jgi:hypothetical protein
LALSLLGQIACKEVEEGLHLGIKHLENAKSVRGASLFGNIAEAYPLCVGVGHGLHEPVELVAHGFGGNTGGSTFEMLDVQKIMMGGITKRSVRERGAR